MLVFWREQMTEMYVSFQKVDEKVVINTAEF